MEKATRGAGRLLLLLAITLIIASCTALLCAQKAQAATSGPFTYEIDGDTVEISKCAPDASGSVQIPAYIEGKPVTRIKRAAFMDCAKITSVSIPNTVTSIGINAFRGCTGLTSVALPNTITTIEDYAFRGCSALGKIDIPASVTSIGITAFSECAFETLAIPASVTHIGDSAFSDCKKLTAVSLQSTLDTIDRDAFARCNLKYVYYSGTSTQWEAIKFGGSNRSGLGSGTWCFGIDGIPSYVAGSKASFDRTGFRAYYAVNGKYFEDQACSKRIDNIDAWKLIPAVKTISLSEESLTYNGKVRKPSITIKDASGAALPSSCYEPIIPESVGVGTYSSLVTLKGDYEGSRDVNYKIVPKNTKINKLVKAKKAFTVKWKKLSTKMGKTRIKGYQVRYSTKASMKSAKTKTVKGYKKTSVKIKKLKAKKKYYVQIRTYMKVGGKTYYSAWSAKKKVKTL